MLHMQLYNDNGCIGKKKMGEDLRTIKTQQNIQSHFLKLLETYLNTHKPQVSEN